MKAFADEKNNGRIMKIFLLSVENMGKEEVLINIRYQHFCLFP